MKTDEKTLLVVFPMFTSSSLEYVAREGAQKTQQIHKNHKKYERVLRQPSAAPSSSSFTIFL